MLGFVIRFIVTLILLSFVLFNEYKNTIYQDLYDGFLELPLYVLILLTFLITSFYDFVLYYKTKKKYLLIPFIFGVFSIILSLNFHLSKMNKLHQKTIYKAYYNWNGNKGYQYIIEFKETGNYVIYESEGESYRTTYYYGKYVIKDSLIFLDKKSGLMQISKKLLIKDIDNDSKSTRTLSKQLIQFDNNGKEISDTIIFKFRELKK